MSWYEVWWRRVSATTPTPDPSVLTLIGFAALAVTSSSASTLRAVGGPTAWPDQGPTCSLVPRPRVHLTTYRGVFAPPQHVVVERAQNLTTNEGSFVVPGLTAAEEGRLLLVVASTYDDRKGPLGITPAITPVADLGRLAAFDRAVGRGPTGDFVLTDGFFALRATLTFATVLRAAP